MRPLSLILSLALCAGSVSTALAQYGLYGAPDTLNLQRMQAAPAAATYPAYPPAQPYNAPQAYNPPQAYSAPQPSYSVAQPYPSTQQYPQVSPATYQAMPVLNEPAIYSATTGPAMVTPQQAAAAPQQVAAAPQYVAPAPAYGQLREEPMADYPPASSSPSNLVDSMVSQDPAYAPSFSDCGCSPSAIGCAEPSCDVCPAPCNPWYGSVMALYMGRDRANGVWTTHQSTNEANQIFNTRMLESDWKVGGEVRLGRRFCCDQWGLEASYWTLDNFDAYASIPRTAASTVSTPLATNYVEFAGNPASDYFNGAAEHRLWRNDEVHSVEVNLLRYHALYDCQSPWSLSVSAGARYFRWSDGLQFGSLSDGHAWGESGGAYEAYLQDRAVNNLIGGQLGFDAGYTVGGRLRLFCSPKFGLYNNHIDNLFQLTRGDGVAADVGSSGVVGTYPVSASKNQISFMTQVDVGFDWEFFSNWNLRLGYRAMAATGMGLADHQIPFYMVDVPEIASIKSNGNLLLHGAFMGVSYNY